MNLSHYLQEIRTHLIQTHSTLFDWFLESPDVKNYRPKDGGWTISEILEHIALTSHFLLILIDKGSDKALRNTKNLSLEELKITFDYDLSKLSAIGLHKSFSWIRPKHMEPKGEKSELEIKEELTEQLRRCLNHLESLKNGEGLLHNTTMTVHNLGKINVYEYIFFLSKHAERHVAQLKENKQEFFK